MEFSTAAAAVAVLLLSTFIVFTSVLPVLLVSFHVTIRRLKPFVPLILVTAWIVFRCSLSTWQESLLELAVEYIVQTRQGIVTALQSSSQSFSSLLPSSLSITNVAVSLVHALGILTEDLCAAILAWHLLRILYCLSYYTTTEWKHIITNRVFLWAQCHVPGVQTAIHQQTAAFQATADQVLHKDPQRQLTLQLPSQGRPRTDIQQELTTFAQAENSKWQQGRVSGTVYGAQDKDETMFMTNVYATYAWSNQLHAGLWPKLNQCEAEVIAMTGHLLHAPTPEQENSCVIGSLTSGGTESILLAVHAHLHHYGRCRGIHHAEIICGTSAHAALNKACEMFGIRQVVIDVVNSDNASNVTYQLQASAVRRAVTCNTIMIYASAPTYPQGVVDPIAELSQVALEYDIGLHVDACLGGFVLPFVSDAPVFDFRLPGVTSMSADTHKYGYASKGTSVVLYRSKELRHGQYFCYPHWTGGMYATPTLAGSRPGALAACAWAAMVSLGHEGYRARVQDIVQAARAIARGIQAMPGLRLLTHEKPYMVVCFASTTTTTSSSSSSTNDDLDIYRVHDALSDRGWTINALQAPACLHVCVTLNMVPHVDTFLQDLQAAVEQARSEGAKGKTKGTAGIYGAVGKLPEGPVECMLQVFTDMTLTP